MGQASTWGLRHSLRGKWINLHTCDHCNLSCTYCYLRNKRQKQPTYDLDHLHRLVASVSGPITVCFYGGEPTLNIPFMEQVVGVLADTPCTFAIQTNGTLLEQVPADLVRRFVGIGVSLDGAEEVADAVRGRGIFAKVTANVRRIAEIARVPVMARMTLTEQNDLARDVDALMEHFPAIYWQIDNDLGSRPHEDFQRRYLEGLPKVIDVWERRAAAGQIVNLVPIFGVYWHLTSLAAHGLPYYHCDPGAGSITIDTDGVIYTCPEGVFRGRAEVGGKDIIGTLPEVTAFPCRGHAPKPECQVCDIHRVCGGRCVWTRESPYCACTKALVSTVVNNAGRLWRYIDRRKLQDMQAVILTTEVIP